MSVGMDTKIAQRKRVLTVIRAGIRGIEPLTEQERAELLALMDRPRKVELSRYVVRGRR